MTTPNGPDFKTMTPHAMAGLIGTAPAGGARPALENRARAALKYFLARALPAEHMLSDSAARNAAPVAGLWDAYNNVPACRDAFEADAWPAKPYTGPRRRRSGSYTPRPANIYDPAPGPAYEPATQTPTQPQEPTAMPVPVLPLNAPAPAPAPVPAPAANNIAAAIQAAIAAALATVTPALDEDRVRQLISEHAPTPQAQTVHHIIETQRQGATLAVIQTAHPQLASVLRRIVRRRHVYLAGPAGSGKTYLATQAAQAAGLAYYSTGAVSSPYALLGYKDATGTYQTTAFRTAYEHGGLFLFDEMDASDPAALLTVNQARDRQPIGFPDGMVACHPNFVMIAAANTFGHGADRIYVGRNQLDGATLNGYAQVALGYDPDLEERLTVAAVPPEHAAQARAWCARVRAIRAEAQISKARVIVSMRAAIYGAEDLADGFTVAEVEESRIFAGHDAATVARLRQAGDAAAPVRQLAQAAE